MAAAAAAVGPGAGGAGSAVPGGAGPCATVSVFPGARLLTIGDANGEIQRHAEQQALRLEVRAGPDSAGIALYSHFCSFYNILKTCRGHTLERSVFSERTEESSAVQYFQFYGYLSQQQNM
ncbi:coactivator associated arginine methyltransferase 1, partial [Homo sapiens]